MKASSDPFAVQNKPKALDDSANVYTFLQRPKLPYNQLDNQQHIPKKIHKLSSYYHHKTHNIPRAHAQ